MKYYSYRKGIKMVNIHKDPHPPKAEKTQWLKDFNEFLNQEVD